MNLTPEQLARRQKYVGSSEIACLFSAELAAVGESTWSTRFELWHQKAGNLPVLEEPPVSSEDGQDPMFWGNVLEPAIAKGFAELHGLKIRRLGENRVAKHRQVPGMAATGDYEILVHPELPGKGLLEIKNVSWPVYKRDWTDGRPPLKFLLQTQHQFACYRREWGYLVPLVGGNKLAPVLLERHGATIGRIEREVEAFWQSIKDGAPPAPDWQADAALISAFHQAVTKGRVLVVHDNPALVDACRRYVDAAAAEKDAKARKDAARAELLTHIGDADEAVLPGFKVKTWEVGAATYTTTRKAHRQVRVTDKEGEQVQ